MKSNKGFSLAMAILGTAILPEIAKAFFFIPAIPIANSASVVVAALGAGIAGIVLGGLLGMIKPPMVSLVYLVL